MTAWFLLFVIVSVGGAIVLAAPRVGGRFALPGAGFTSSGW